MPDFLANLYREVIRTWATEGHSVPLPGLGSGDSHSDSRIDSRTDGAGHNELYGVRTILMAEVGWLMSEDAGQSRVCEEMRK